MAGHSLTGFSDTYASIIVQKRSILEVILVGRPLLGRFTTVTGFLPVWIMALTVVRWSPKALEMAL